jgi:hypothetical protein
MEVEPGVEVEVGKQDTGVDITSLSLAAGILNTDVINRRGS